TGFRRASSVIITPKKTISVRATGPGDTATMQSLTDDARPVTRRLARRTPFRAVARLLALTLAFAVLGPVVAAPPSVEAAGYTVWSCRAADGTPVGTTAWRGSG